MDDTVFNLGWSNELDRLQALYPIARTLSCVADADTSGYRERIVAAFDVQDKLLFIGKEKVRFEEIFAVDLLTEESIRTITTSDAGAWSLLGGLLIGPVGALVGAASGTQVGNTEHRKCRIGVEIRIADICRPRLVVCGTEEFNTELYATIQALIAQNNCPPSNLPLCPECGHAISKYAQFCVHCGCTMDAIQRIWAEQEQERQSAREKAEKQIALLKSTGITPIEVIAPGRIKCSACGKVQKEGRSTCQNCGAPFTQEAVDEHAQKEEERIRKELEKNMQI